MLQIALPPSGQVLNVPQMYINNEATLHDQQSVGDAVNVTVKGRNVSGDNTGDNKVVATVVSSVDSALQRQRRNRDDQTVLENTM